MEPDEALSESLALDRLMEVEEDRDSFLQPSPAVGESFLLPSSKTRFGKFEMLFNLFSLEWLLTCVVLFQSHHSTHHSIYILANCQVHLEKEKETPYTWRHLRGPE